MRYKIIFIVHLGLKTINIFRKKSKSKILSMSKIKLINTTIVVVNLL